MLLSLIIFVLYSIDRDFYFLILGVGTYNSTSLPGCGPIHSLSFIDRAYFDSESLVLDQINNPGFILYFERQ